MSGNIVWLASYPKSGNTWLRIFLTKLMSGAGQPVSINRLLGNGAGERTVFDALTGIDSSNLFPEEADRMRPELYKRISREAGDFHWMKVHDAYRYAPGKQPIFPPEVTRCTIYIVRNPLDVVPSFAHHMAWDIDQAIDNLNNDRYAINSETENITSHLSQQLSSWSENVMSWLNAPCGMNVHVMRYEDMKKSPFAAFSKAVSAMGIAKTEEEILRALEFSSFASLKEMESRVGFREKPAHAHTFFRDGKTGGWRNALTPMQVEKVILKHKDAMQLFGYLDEQGNIVDG